MSAAIPEMEDRSRFYWQVFGAFMALIVVRTLGIHNVYFLEEDEISIAAGAAALVRDNFSAMYRYTPQLGYYRILEAIDRLAGGDVSLIPAIMRGLSVFSGTLIPVLGLFAFRRSLSARQRWLIFLVLAINPVVWKCSQYGNTGILAAAMAGLAVVIFSNSPSRSSLVTGFFIFGAAVLVRADSILLSPVIAFFLYRDRGSIWKAMVPCLLFALGLAAAYLVIFSIDPRIDSAAAAVSTHMGNSPNHFFWEYLVWAISPIPLFFSIWGGRGLLDRKPWLVVALLVWLGPSIAFYFAATTTPRYFLNMSIPLAIAAAIGIEDLAKRLNEWLAGSLAWGAALGLAMVHLFVGLGHFYGGTLSPFYGPVIVTDDRDMPTGALIYHTYLEGGLFQKSFANEGFGRTPAYWEPPLFTAVLKELSDYSGPPRKILFLLEGGWAHAFHFHAQVAGARYVSLSPPVEPYLFYSLTKMEVGVNTISTIGRSQGGYIDEIERFDLAAGDQLWVMGADPFPNAAELRKLPPGIEPVLAGNSRSRLRIYEMRDISR